MQKTQKYKFKKLESGKSKATPRKDVVDFEDLIGGGTEETAVVEQTKKRKAEETTTTTSTTTTTTTTTEKQQKKRHKSSKNNTSSKKSEKIVKRIVKEEMDRFLASETNETVVRLVRSICRTFVINICSETGPFKLKRSTPEDVVRPRQNPKNLELIRNINIMEEQIACYVAEESAWQSLKDHLTEEAKALENDENVGEITEISVGPSDIEKMRNETEKKFLGALQSALTKADDLQRSLNKAENISASALDAKVKLAKTFEKQMRASLTLDNKTPRKLIKSMLQ